MKKIQKKARLDSKSNGKDSDCSDDRCDKSKKDDDQSEFNKKILLLLRKGRISQSRFKIIKFNSKHFGKIIADTLC